MNKKRITILLSAVALVLVAVITIFAKNSAGSTPNSDNKEENEMINPEEAEITTKTFAADEQYVKVTGRTAYIDRQRWFTFSAGKIEFEFYGTAVSIDVLGDFTSENPEDRARQSHIGIELDGERVVDTLIETKNNTFEVLKDEGQEPAWHTVSFIKLSELNQSSCAVTGITANCGGDIRPVQNKDLYIEFIGDSLTCGYGVLGPGPEEPFLTETEDVTLTHVAVCADELNADYSVVANSGFGVFSGACDGDEKNLQDLLPPIYDKLAINAGQYECEDESTNVYNRTRPFDVCVINLGTNDGTYTHPWNVNRVPYEDRVEEFFHAYKEFLAHVREMNPDAKIVCAHGLMDTVLGPTVKKAMEEYKNETGDTEVYYTNLPTSLTYGSGYHPSKQGHEAAGKKLAEFIDSILNGETE